MRTGVCFHAQVTDPNSCCAAVWKDAGAGSREDVDEEPNVDYVVQLCALALCMQEGFLLFRARNPTAPACKGFDARFCCVSTRATSQTHSPIRARRTGPARPEVAKAQP